MLRAVLLSIVLTLAGGQNIALLCGLWCHTEIGTAEACEHTTTLEMLPNDDCTVSSGAITYLQEEIKGSATPKAEGDIPVPQFVAIPPAIHAISKNRCNSDVLLELQPLILSLRI